MAKNMCKKIISLVIIALFICSSSHASSEDKVVVKEDVVVLRGKGEKPREVTIRLPKVSGLKDEKVLSKLNELLSLNSIFPYISIEDIRKEVSEDDMGVQWVDYEVEYNQHNILDITVSMEAWGAYPSTFSVRRIFNLKTGEPLKGSEVFKKEKINKLLRKVKTLKKAEEKESLDDPIYTDEERETILDGIERAKAYALEDLDHFSISDKGLTFLYDYGTFPHAVRALQPLGSYFISFKDLKPYIDPKGPLGIFVK